MTQEEQIRQELIDKFGLGEAAVAVQRPRRVFCEVGQAIFFEVLEYIYQWQTGKNLCSIIGLDEIEKNMLSVIYCISQQEGIMIAVKVSVPRENPVIDTVTRYFPGAEVFERELVDLFGFQVDGLGEGNRYPLPDDWPVNEYPLRKDWKQIRAGESEGTHA